MWMPLLAASALASAPVDAVVLVQQGSTTCAGAVVSEAGDVVTAYHCVAAGGRPRITTSDGRATVGRVVASRAWADLAVIAAPDLAGSAWIPVAEAVPEVGSPVQVIGHPYGSRPPTGFLEGTLRWSVSRGIVSAIGRTALQVDAPVNPGNSGGPLVDEDGRLVGVVSRKTAGGEGIGFGARSELVEALLREAPRAMSPFGGTVAAGVQVSAFEGSGGIVAVGPVLEVAFRDRVVLTGTWGFGASARWGAVRFGEVRWNGPEGRVGLRQRLFRGPYTTRVDVFGGVVGIQSLRGDLQHGEVDLERAMTPAPLLGGALRVGRGGFVLTRTLDGEMCATVELRWPGVLTVF